MGSEAPLLPVTYTPFFILNNLRDFDGIIGVDLIKQVNAKLDFTGNVLHTSKGTEKTKNIKTRKNAVEMETRTKTTSNSTIRGTPYSG